MIGGKWKRASCTLPTSGAALVCRSCVVQGDLRCYYSGFDPRMALTTFVERHSEFDCRASSDTLPEPTVVTMPFDALGIAWSNSGNRLIRSLTRFDLAFEQNDRNIEFG